MNEDVMEDVRIYHFFLTSHTVSLTFFSHGCFSLFFLFLVLLFIFLFFMFSLSVFFIDIMTLFSSSVFFVCESIYIFASLSFFHSYLPSFLPSFPPSSFFSFFFFALLIDFICINTFFTIFCLSLFFPFFVLSVLLTLSVSVSLTFSPTASVSSLTFHSFLLFFGDFMMYSRHYSVITIQLQIIRSFDCKI